MTIFAAVSKADPKHGRWILPLVIVGLIGFTYLFVNALPPGPGGETDTTVAANGGDGGTTSTTAAENGDGNGTETTTTAAVDPEVRAFSLTLDGFIETAETLAADAQQINDDWDARTVNYANTQELMGGLITSTDEFVGEVEQFEPPSEANEAWVSVLGITPELEAQAAAMLDGLVNSSGSEERLAALNAYRAAAADLAAAFEAARTAVAG